MQPSLVQVLQATLFSLCFVWSSAAFSFQEAPAKENTPTENSTDKERTVPNELTKKVGSAIRWELDYPTALAKAKQQGKPIFWYVPSIPGTFMDRKEEVDRYMLAGPFSWPAIIDLINDRCIPLRAVPSRALSKQFDLLVYKFIEPGFLIVQPNEDVTLLANRLTTLHPKWLFQVLKKSLEPNAQQSNNEAEFLAAGPASMLNKAVTANWQVDQSTLDEMLRDDSTESQLLAGMCVFKMGRHDQARSLWEKASVNHPNHPLAWKAACEAQGLGPFYRGMEVLEILPKSLDEYPDLKNVTSAAPRSTYSEEELWTRSVQFLLGMQHENGGFLDSDYDFGGTDSLKNVHVAVSSLAGLSLLEASKKPMFADQDKRIQSALSRIKNYVSNDANLNLFDRDEILWAQAYRIRFLAAMQTEKKEPSPESLQKAVTQLESLQLKTGGWYHEYANAFVSATALTALFDAKQAGAKTDEVKIDRGLKRLASQRFSNGAYPYATRRENGKGIGTENDLAGAGGRIAICELARRRWGEINDTDFVAAVGKSMEYHELLAKALKYDNHTSTFAYGGFFFWYDMQARSESIALIADAESKIKLTQQQKELILALPEIDGCFIDSHELGRSYGTAMALLSLSALE